MKIFLMALAVSAFATPAVAQSIPHFDVDAYCKEVANTGGSYSAMLDKSCFRMEQEAYNTIKPAWSSVPGETQQYCSEVAAVSGPGSYMLLKSCVEMETKAASSNAGRSFDY